MTAAKHSVVIKKTFSASRERVFKAFSSAQAISDWFKPQAEISIDVLVFEFKPGGQYRFRYVMPSGEQPILGGLYEEIEAPHKIVFTWVWETPDIHENQNTRVSIELQECDSGTELLLTHEKLDSEDQATRHKAGWEATLERLEQSINTEH